MEQLAITDALTGLLQFPAVLSRQIKLEIQRFKRYSRALSLLILDIDFFQKLQRHLGTHLEGDKVLMGIGRVISSCMRSMDYCLPVRGRRICHYSPGNRPETKPAW